MKADEEDIAADAVGTTRVGYVWRGVSGLPIILHLLLATPQSFPPARHGFLAAPTELGPPP